MKITLNELRAMVRSVIAEGKAVDPALLAVGKQVKYASPRGGSGFEKRGEGKIIAMGQRWVRLELTVYPHGQKVQLPKHWVTDIVDPNAPAEAPVAAAEPEPAPPPAAPEKPARKPRVRPQAAQ